MIPARRLTAIALRLAGLGQVGHDHAGFADLLRQPLQRFLVAR